MSTTSTVPASKNLFRRMFLKSSTTAIAALIGLFLIVVLSASLYLLTRPPKQAELKGEVFIVTKGAQNFKLGLVEVIAIPEEKMKPFIENKLLAINLEFSKYESLKQATGREIEQAQQAYGEAKAGYEALNAKYETATSTADKAQEDANALTAYSGYSSPEDVAAYEIAIKRANKAKQQAEQLALQVESKRKEVEAKEAELSVSKSATNNGFLKAMKLLTNEALSEGLPSEGTKVATNSDGQFSMSLPSDRKYALAARAQRRVFDSTEQYYWLIWVPLEGQETKYVMLTNRNLMGEDSSDTVFKTKDLVPTGLREQ
jgi:hypothetical protein